VNTRADDGQAEDTAASIRRYCRSIQNALRAVDLANPAATVITNRMRGTVENLLVDLSELRYFLPDRAKD
jgi:hypothetical protein